MEKGAYEFLINMEKDHFWSKSRRNIITKVLLSCFNKNDCQTKTALEIGCGSGFNLNYFKDFFKLIDGVEYDEEMVKIAKENNPSVCVSQGGLPFSLGADKKYDAIFLLDVLEHIEDDKASLIEIKKLLNPNGVLIVTVPAMEFLWSIHDEKNHHFRRYSKNSLLKVAHEAGLHVRYISYFNCILFPLVVLQRFVYKLMNQNRIDKVYNKPFKNTLLNKILYCIFNLESALLPKITLPYGSSLICVINNENN